MDYLNENNSIVDVDLDQPNRAVENFTTKQPIHLEVGTGMGRFITTLATKNPDINYVGIEIDKNIMIRVVDEVKTRELENVQLALLNADSLTEYFKPKSIERIYLNFSDPWPKVRHAKRRLTFESFLKQYQTLLIEDGELHFKTDNRGLFEFSLLSMNEFGMKFLDVQLDLHADEPEDNIRTEYEDKFSRNGNPIYRLIAKF